MARNVQLKILDPRVAPGGEFGLPEYKTPLSAGVDLCACIGTPICVAPGETFLIPTGIAVNMADPSIGGFLIPRSGLGHKHGIVLGNLQGVIDADYQGQIFVSVWNRNPNVVWRDVEIAENVTGLRPFPNDAANFIVKPGERIAQMVFKRVEQVQFEIVTGFGESTVRGEGGFGSTGGFTASVTK